MLQAHDLEQNILCSWPTVLNPQATLYIRLVGCLLSRLVCPAPLSGHHKVPLLYYKTAALMPNYGI